ncbi:MAG: FHA domain-containing protein [Thermoanaerobaculia bacterium]
MFDSERHELTCGGVTKPLPPKAFQLLVALVSAHPAAISKQELYAQLWPGVFVEEGNLHNLVADVREAIGDSERTIIRTVHRVGYAFAADVVQEEPSIARLVIGSREWPLAQGETIVGRDLLGTPDVSRRHAAITVTGASARIRDLDSKNGTFVRGSAIHGEAEVANGDEIVFGMTRAVILFNDQAGTTITAARVIESPESARDR